MKKPDKNNDERPQWQRVIQAAIESTGILREESLFNWSVRWPVAYRPGGDISVRDNMIYNLAGYASAALERAGEDNVTETQTVAYTYELLVGPDGCWEQVASSLGDWCARLPPADTLRRK